MSNKETLQSNLDRLRSEQTALRSELTATQQQLTVVTDERKAAQRQYDTGHDSALADVERLTTERDELEQSIVKLQRSLDEYPARIEHVAKELGIAAHRDNLHALLELRRLEFEAFSEFEAATLALIEAHDAMSDVHVKRKALASRLEQTARQYSLGSFDRGDVNLPTARTVGEWLESRSGIVMAENDFARVRLQFGEM